MGPPENTTASEVREALRDLDAREVILGLRQRGIIGTATDSPVFRQLGASAYQKLQAASLPIPDETVFHYAAEKITDLLLATGESDLTDRENIFQMAERLLWYAFINDSPEQGLRVDRPIDDLISSGLVTMIGSAEESIERRTVVQAIRSELEKFRQALAQKEDALPERHREFCFTCLDTLAQFGGMLAMQLESNVDFMGMLIQRLDLAYDASPRDLDKFCEQTVAEFGAVIARHAGSIERFTWNELPAHNTPTPAWLVQSLATFYEMARERSRRKPSDEEPASRILRVCDLRMPAEFGYAAMGNHPHATVHAVICSVQEIFNLFEQQSPPFPMQPDDCQKIVSRLRSEGLLRSPAEKDPELVRVAEIVYWEQMILALSEASSARPMRFVFNDQAISGIISGASPMGIFSTLQSTKAAYAACAKTCPGIPYKLRLALQHAYDRYFENAVKNVSELPGSENFLKMTVSNIQRFVLKQGADVAAYCSLLQQQYAPLILLYREKICQTCSPGEPAPVEVGEILERIVGYALRQEEAASGYLSGGASPLGKARGENGGDDFGPS